ncbi:glycoside hydrolase family 18 protein [Halosquirtibacter laminarini]|uniref:Glycoside hydrolase family 18 protein n=1 Tax=Halosquirtibacter laminarini TaxID=3374600 RepID=A0AC61NQV2_9BACT|nr:glycoside hydrolase family 18 protein [Prolixibacteraceae bacterium]
MSKTLRYILYCFTIIIIQSCIQDVKKDAVLTTASILKKNNPHLNRDYHATIQDNNIVWDAKKELFKKDIIVTFRHSGDTMIPQSNTPFNLSKKIDLCVISDSINTNKATHTPYHFKFRNPVPKVKRRWSNLRFKKSSKTDQRLIIGYFPSWLESTPTPNSKLREVPGWINHLFIAFAKPEMRYKKKSYSLKHTGLQFHYPHKQAGTILKNSIKVLHAKGIKVLLSIGGGTYCNDLNLKKIHWREIKNFVDDMGFDGIDWDIEPKGSFYRVGEKKYISYYIEVIRKSRKYFPQKKYIIACAPSGVGALGGRINNDPTSPFAYEKRNLRTQESDYFLRKNTTEDKRHKSISLYGFRSTGHMIPVIKRVGYLIDIIAYQGYNIGVAKNREILYDSYAYYGGKYGFSVAAGTHVPLEGWGPFYKYGKKDVANLSKHIAQNQYGGSKDGLMVWHLLRKESFLNNRKMAQFWRKLKWNIWGGSSADGYQFLYIADRIFKGDNTTHTLSIANNYPKEYFTTIKKLKSRKKISVWSQNRYYSKGDMVSFNGIIWKANNYNVNQMPKYNPMNPWIAF